MRSCYLLPCMLLGVSLQLAQGETVRLATAPALSPDGQRLAFSYRGDLWVVRSKGGQARRITNHPGHDTTPCFSPDGKRLAFVSNRDNGNQVYLIPLTGGSARQLTHHTEGFELHQWYPNGESVLVSASRDQFWRRLQRTFRLTVGERRAPEMLFDAYAVSPSLSQDGKKLLFVREGERWWRKGYQGPRAAQVWLYELETGEYSKLSEEGVDWRWPLWMKDGQGFYFTKDDGEGFDLWKYRMDGSLGESGERITNFEEGSVVFPTLSRDGSTLVFRHRFDLYRVSTQNEAKSKRLKITAVEDDLTPDEMRRELKSATRVAFSEDALEIALIAGGDIWVMDTELREPVRVTATAGYETDLVFGKDSETLYFISNQEGQADIWKAERSDEEAYWWRNTSFRLTRITNDPAVEADLRLSPDGKRMFYVRERGDLWSSLLNGDDARQHFTGFELPDYDISPDGRWIAYAHSDDDFNRDVWIAPVDGSQKPFNLSRHTDNDSNPVWSPDGTKLAFTGRRMDDEVDIYYVWLQDEEADKSSRLRKLDEALKKMQKERKSPQKSATPPRKSEQESQSKDDETDQDGEEEGGKKDENAEDMKEADAEEQETITIDFERIHKRLRRISIRDTYESNLFWSPTGDKLAFQAEIDGKRGIYTIEFPNELTPKLLSTTTGSQHRWLKQRERSIVMLNNGIPTSLTESGGSTAYNFTAFQTLSRSKRFQEAFWVCWRTMRDRWYDDRLGNNNWDQVRRDYEEMAAQASDPRMFGTVVQLMLGELNGSHLGFYPSSESTPDESGWRPTTAHLGVLFDPEYQGPGLKIQQVLEGGPAARSHSKLEAGEVILTIDTVTVDPQMDLTEVLNGRLARDIVLRVRSSAVPEAEKEDKPAEREVLLRPISFSAARRLLYDAWLEENRRRVETRSEGKLGYLHIQAMSDSSFKEFERQLYDVGFGKDGLVIDVRENGGGSTTDLLLTSLTQPVHAITVPRGGGRGYPQSRKVFASWSKPIVVLCNQNSYSNAEIFSHAIKTLKRGKLVGVPTAGGVISTGSVRIMDVGRMRMPFRGWFLSSNGEDMELNGAVPDEIIWPAPGEISNGTDRQLDRAVELLLEDVVAAQAQPSVQLRKATER